MAPAARLSPALTSEPSAAGPDRSVRLADRIFHAVVAAALAAAFAVSLWPVDLRGLPPTFGVRDESRSICLLRWVTGMPCPTCGVTRAFRAVGQGAMAEALAFHPLGPVLYVVFVVVMVRSAGVAVRGRTWLDRTARVLVWSIPVLAMATLVTYAVRMGLFVSSGAAAEAWQASPLRGLLSALS